MFHEIHFAIYPNHLICRQEKGYRETGRCRAFLGITVVVALSGYAAFEVAYPLPEGIRRCLLPFHTHHRSMGGFPWILRTQTLQKQTCPGSVSSSSWSRHGSSLRNAAPTF